MIIEYRKAFISKYQVVCNTSVCSYSRTCMKHVRMQEE